MNLLVYARCIISFHNGLFVAFMRLFLTIFSAKDKQANGQLCVKQSYVCSCGEQSFRMLVYLFMCIIMAPTPLFPAEDRSTSSSPGAPPDDESSFNPAGSRVATAGFDNTVHLWDSVTGRLLSTLIGHTNAVSSVAWSPDGTRIATASLGGYAFVWNSRGSVMLNLLGHVDDIHSVAWSPDGTKLATASSDHTARVWDSNSGSLLLTYSGHSSSPVYSAAWSPDGTQIVTASSDWTARIWDSRRGSTRLVLSGHSHSVLSASWSPDGKKIATASYDLNVFIWDSSRGAKLSALPHPDYVYTAQYSPDGTKILTSSDDMKARVWDSSSGITLLTLTGHTSFVRSATWSPDGSRIATASWDLTARVWDGVSGRALLTLTGHSLHVRAVAWFPGSGLFEDIFPPAVPDTEQSINSDEMETDAKPTSEPQVCGHPYPSQWCCALPSVHMLLCIQSECVTPLSQAHLAFIPFLIVIGTSIALCVHCVLCCLLQCYFAVFSCNTVTVNLNLVLRYCKKNDIHNTGFIVSFTIALVWLSLSVNDTA
jgi:Tol biopolymer transport system component